MNPSLRRVITYVDQNYMHKLTLDGIARNVYLNKTYVSQLFTKQLGISFSNYLEGIRVKRACELLRGTELSVTEIAGATGYASQSYFSKVFKKRIGITPFEYRELHGTNMTLLSDFQK